MEARLAGKFLKPGEEYFYRFETTHDGEPGRPLPDRAAGRLARAGEDRLLLLPGLAGGLLRRAQRDRPRGRRPGGVPRRLHLRAQLLRRAAQGHARREQGRRGADAAPSTARSTACTRPTPTCARCTRRRRSPRSGTTTRWRTTTPASKPGEETQQRRVPVPRAASGNGYRAFYEYMPFKPLTGEPEIGHDLYRRMRLGSNVELFLLDERQYRDDQPCGDAFFTPCAEAESEPRTLPRATAAGLAEAPAARVGRRLEAGRQPADDHVARHRARARRSTRTRGTATGASARELLEHIRAFGIQDVSFLTGDIHTFFAGDVGVDGRGPESVATEFVGGSITSLGVPETLQGATGAPLTKEQFLLISNNLPVDQPAPQVPGAVEPRLRRGRGVSPSELKVTFKAVDSLRRTSAHSHDRALPGAARATRTCRSLRRSCSRLRCGQVPRTRLELARSPARARSRPRSRPRTARRSRSWRSRKRLNLRISRV